LHGLLSHRDHTFAPRLAAAISARLNVFTYRCDLRGHAPHPLEPTFRFRIGGFEDDADDAACAAKELHRMRGLTLAAVIGHSRGASTALCLFGTLDAGVRACLSRAALVAISPRYFVGGIRGKFSDEQVRAAEAQGSFRWCIREGVEDAGVTITAEDLSMLHTFNMGDVVRRISPTVPILVVHGSADKAIPQSDSEACVAARNEEGPAKPAALLIVRGANHNFQSSKHEKQMADAVLDFLAVHCGSSLV
jgi:pimeloyl-ACP methyl ester carboxylesterase